VLSINRDNAVNVVEVPPPPAVPNVLFTDAATYDAGERFRIYVADNHDGTATISFSRLDSTCTPGVPCSETVFYTHPAATPYPLRVDASFREASLQGDPPGSTPASLKKVTIMRIKTQ